MSNQEVVALPPDLRVAGMRAALSYRWVEHWRGASKVHKHVFVCRARGAAGGCGCWRGCRMWFEVGGDTTGTYVLANAHDGTLDVTAAVTPVRIVCANTLGHALNRPEGVDAQRTFKCPFSSSHACAAAHPSRSTNHRAHERRPRVLCSAVAPRGMRAGDDRRRVGS